MYPLKQNKFLIVFTILAFFNSCSTIRSYEDKSILSSIEVEIINLNLRDSDLGKEMQKNVCIILWKDANKKYYGKIKGSRKRVEISPVTFNFVESNFDELKNVKPKAYTLIPKGIAYYNITYRDKTFEQKVAYSNLSRFEVGKYNDKTFYSFLLCVNEDVISVLLNN